MLHPNRLSSFCMLLLVASSLSLSASSLPANTLQHETMADVAIPAFVRSACLYRVDPSVNVECGFLLTREVHGDPNSRIIRLHVVLIRSTSEQPVDEPLILLNGGPGSAGAPLVSSMFNDYIGDAWRSQRDVIYIDQRGTNYSIPSLQCNEALVTSAEISQLSYRQQVAAEEGRLEDCYTSLQDQGINLSAYNLQESAADINDLRLALGLEQINLYGYSYGTLLAMVVARDYPEGIRSVILDSVLPVGVDLRLEKLPSLQNGLDTLFDACRMDADCRASYPQLAQHFIAVVERLRASPAEVDVSTSGNKGSIWIDDLKFLNYVVSLLQQSYIQYLPSRIEAVYVGDYSGVAQTWQTYTTSADVSRYRGDNCATGLYFSTICSYLQSDLALDNAFDDEFGLNSEYHPIYSSLVEFAAHAYSPCEFWQVAPMDSGFSTVIQTSTIPTLLLSGTFDPVLSPYFVQQILPQFTNGYWYELPVGHGAIFSPCGLRLTYDFLADPSHAPNAGCVDAMKVDWVLQEMK